MNYHLKRTNRLENKPNELPAPVSMQKSVSFSKDSLGSFSSNNPIVASTDNQNATFSVATAGGTQAAGVGAFRAELAPRRRSSLLRRPAMDSEDGSPLSGLPLQRRKDKHSDEEVSLTPSSYLDELLSADSPVPSHPVLAINRRTSLGDRRTSLVSQEGGSQRSCNSEGLRRRSSITGGSEDIRKAIRRVQDVDNSLHSSSSIDHSVHRTIDNSHHRSSSHGHRKRASITAFAKDLLPSLRSVNPPTLQIPRGSNNSYSGEVYDACLRVQGEEFKKPIKVPLISVSSPYKNGKPTDTSTRRAVSPLSDIMKRFKCRSMLYGFYLVTISVAYISFFRESTMQDHLSEMIKSHQEVQATVASLNQSMEQNKNLVSNLHSEVSELYEANEDLKSASEQVDSDYKMQLRGVQLVQENDKITKTMDILISNNNNMADEMSVLIDKVQLESYRQVHER